MPGDARRLARRPAQRSGYIIYCTRCGAGRGIVWAPVGGTSAAAPLMAAMTADADESAGKRLGFANPFLYAQAGTPVFRDIVSGTNNLFGGHKLHRPPGYDLATGLGSVRAAPFADGARRLRARRGVGRLDRPPPRRPATAAGSPTGAR